MENDILDSLNDICYEGPLNDETTFAKALEGGPKSLEYAKLVHVLAEELKQLCQLEETVNEMKEVDDSSSFLLELSSFLKELGCPYKSLVTGHMSSRLQTKEDCLLLLDYLISELMAARMVKVDQPKEKSNNKMDIIVRESTTAKDLKDILITLKFNKPPPNITPEMLFAKMEAKLKDTLQKEGSQLVGKPLYNKALTEKDWKALEISFSEMYEEYRLRREMLITRLECTIQSCEWSDRLKTKKEIIQSISGPIREQMKAKPDVRLADFLAARTSLLLVEKTSNANVRKNTQSEVNKVIIGQGGRGGGRGGDRGGRGGDRGGRFGAPPGRVQGGYNQDRGDLSGQYAKPHRSYQTYEVPPGGYGQNNGNYNQNQSGYNQNQTGGYNYKQGGYDNQAGYNQGVITRVKEAITRIKEVITKAPARTATATAVITLKPPHTTVWAAIIKEGGRGGGRGGDRGGRGGDRGGRFGAPPGRVQGGYNQDRGDLSGQYAKPHRSYQTYEVPPGGYGQNNGNYNQNQSGYNQNQTSGYNYKQGGYDNQAGYNQGGYNQSQGGYNQNQGSYNKGPSQNRDGYGGYNTQTPAYDSMGSYNQGGGRSGGYQTYAQDQNYSSQGNPGYQRRGGYQNEHDDRDRRGRGGYRGRR
ncbi:hypothetical protein ACJJTC_011439 [Scirpophaga incertulas]